MIFTDRRDAGRRLAEPLRALNLPNPVVLALPRGGVPIGVEIARALDAPLDLLIVRKIGTPGFPEVAMAAVADPTGIDDGIGPGSGVAPTVVNEDVFVAAGSDSAGFERARADELREIDRRRLRYRGDRPPLEVRGKTAIVVDDGVATGATARAALLVLRGQHAARTVLAVPVGPAETLMELREEADAVVFLSSPRDFWAIGQFYVDFHQLSDEETIGLLASVWDEETPPD